MIPTMSEFSFLLQIALDLKNSDDFEDKVLAAAILRYLYQTGHRLLPIRPGIKKTLAFLERNINELDYA